MSFWKKLSKKTKRELLLRFAAVLVSGVIFEVVAFMSFAWFYNNPHINASGMQVVVSTVQFELSVLENGTNGMYYDEYHSLVHDSNSIIWQMTAENNMYNHEENSSGLEEEEGIHPGSYGVISFYVTPRKDSLYLDFQFEILGYSSSEDEETGEITMTLLDSETDPAEYLNGHILLFANRTGTDRNYVYSNPILSNEDMKRVITGNHFTGSGTRTQVDIYWIWPITLSSIVDATSCQKVNVTQIPFVDSSAGYSQVVNNIETYPEYYFSFGEGTSINSSSVITEAWIARDYDVFGGLYDQADNKIGTGVRFVLLKLTVTEGSPNVIDSSGN